MKSKIPVSDIIAAAINSAEFAGDQPAVAALRMISAELEAKIPDWKPIETAPKDGTEILGWMRGAGVVIMLWIAPCDFILDSELMREDSFFKEDWFFLGLDGGQRLSGKHSPTHWMPLPTPPTE